MGRTNTLLVVEDDELLCEMLEDLFIEAGFRVQTARNRDEAVAAMTDLPFDVVLTDLSLGRESGLDMLAAVAERLPQAASVLMSALIDPEIEERAHRLGAFATLRKPFHTHEVFGVVERALLRATAGPRA